MKETIIRNDPAKDAEELKKGVAVVNVKRYDTIRLEYCLQSLSDLNVATNAFVGPFLFR